MVFINKEIGETPLEALERYRKVSPQLIGKPMTYAGRLDPMASGELLILIGDECKNKDKYLGLDKEYEIEIAFGVETDTYDALGIASDLVNISEVEFKKIENIIRDLCLHSPIILEQEYPAYSSKTVDGVSLHELARKGKLPEVMPTKKVTIYEVDSIEKSLISTSEFRKRILNDIKKVKGDFRQEEITHRWIEVLKENDFKIPIFTLRIKCSSGTYMRSLAHRLGRESGVGACAIGINRKKIFLVQYS